MGKIKLGLLLLLMTLVGTPMTGYGMQLSESELYARSACLMDADSGRVLYSKNSEQKLPMASTTKIMTCILALEDGRMDDLVTVSAYAASHYGLFNAQDRGTLFIGPGEKVYAGMIVGENPRTEDIEVNVCKTKHLTNTRSSSADEALRLVPPKILSLEQALDYIDTDELLEVTPNHLRIRKKILDSTLRYRANKK